MNPIQLIESAFPNLCDSVWQITSEPDREYNCIGWAVGTTVENWWPNKAGVWPIEAPRETTIDAFSAAFQTKGYFPCEHGELEEGFEKIALYALESAPKHAARQLADGRWTSKLGVAHDIEHATPESVEGEVYGNVVRFFKRKRSDQP